MTQGLLVLAVALTAGLIVFGITVLLTGEDGGLRPPEPDARAVPLPADRPLVEADVERVRFDTAPRGYRMAQVDAALRRAAYDIGYKEELTRVLLAEVEALRDGRFPEAEVLRRAREAAVAPRVSDEAPEPGAVPGTHSSVDTPRDDPRDDQGGQRPPADATGGVEAGGGAGTGVDGQVDTVVETGEEADGPGKGPGGTVEDDTTLSGRR